MVTQKVDDVISNMIAFAFQNSWVNNVSSYEDIMAHKEGKRIYVDALIKNGVTTDETIISNLPVGWRPLQVAMRGVFSFDGTNVKAGFVRIRTNGDIIISKNVGNTYLALSFSFYTQ